MTEINGLHPRVSLAISEGYTSDENLNHNAVIRSQIPKSEYLTFGSVFVS